MTTEWSTISGTFVTTINSTQTITLSLYTISPVPANQSIAESTWYVWPSSDTTVQVFQTWTNDLAPTPVTSTFIAGGETSTRRPTDTGQTTSGQSRAPTSSTAGPESTASGNGTSTQTPSVDPGHSSSDGVSTGALAGAVVGSVIGSTLLTLLLAFLFFRRRRSPPRRASDEDVTLTAIVPNKFNTGFSLATIIPQPADDETVRRRVLTLIDHAGLHVDNYYTTASPALSPDAIAKLNKFDSGFLPMDVGMVLGERKSQRQVITHILVYKLLQAIRPGGELLPPLLAGQPRIENSSVSTDDALFTWRMLSAHLYREAKYSRNQTQMAALTKAAQDLALNFTKAFTPYALPNFSETDRVTHFKDLAAATTELGIWLFAQPCTLEFVWNKSQTEIMVVPRVLKTYDEQGNRLSTPQVLIEGDRAPILMTGFRHEMS